MTYRDDLAAAQARIRQLEEDLEDSRQTVDELRQALAEKKKPEPRAPDKPQPRLKKLGKIVFKSPPSYVPLFKLLARAASVSFRLCPETKPLSSKVFAVWLAYKVLYWPLMTLVYRPLYYVFLVFPLLPVAAIVITLASLLLAPIIFVSRFRISDGETDPFHDPRWLRGEFTDGQGALFLWILLSCGMQPLLPFYFTLLGHSEE